MIISARVEGSCKRTWVWKEGIFLRLANFNKGIFFCWP